MFYFLTVDTRQLLTQVRKSKIKGKLYSNCKQKHMSPLHKSLPSTVPYIYRLRIVIYDNTQSLYGTVFGRLSSCVWVGWNTHHNGEEIFVNIFRQSNWLKIFQKISPPQWWVAILTPVKKHDTTAAKSPKTFSEYNNHCHIAYRISKLYVGSQIRYHISTSLSHIEYYNIYMLNNSISHIEFDIQPDVWYRNHVW